jgi:ribulose-phosphate 3-epimerase
VGWEDWIRTVEIEPSLYAADFARLGEQVEVLLRTGARIFHFDIGDGHFVPPITVGPVVLQSIAPLVHREGGKLDCHLMIESPEKHFAMVRVAGGDSVTVHYEVCPDLAPVVGAAREVGFEGVGLAFNPETEPDAVAAAAEGFDLVNCMTVHPGYSGQKFLPGSLERIARLRELLPPAVQVQVDGGVDYENARPIYDAGARLLVAGNSIFGREDLPRAYRRLVQALA